MNGEPFGRSTFELNHLPGLIATMHRYGSKVLPLLFITAIFDDSGNPNSELWGLSAFYPNCENAISRVSAITSSRALRRGVVTAHELGHAIGCLPHKPKAHGWGPEWPMRDFEAAGTKLDLSEIILLRRNARGIP